MGGGGLALSYLAPHPLPITSDNLPNRNFNCLPVVARWVSFAVKSIECPVLIQIIRKLEEIHLALLNYCAKFEWNTFR